MEKATYQLAKKADRLEWTIKSLYLGWLRNHMQVLTGMAQAIFPRKQKTIIRLECFLDDVNSHFLSPHCGRPVRHALRWLRRFLKVYPRVSKPDGARAIQMISQVYRELGFKLWPDQSFEEPFQTTLALERFYSDRKEVAV